MSYKLSQICDVCGDEENIPAATLANIVAIADVFSSRAVAMTVIKMRGDTEIKTQCPKCARATTVPEGSVRIGENLETVLGRTGQKAD